MKRTLLGVAGFPVGHSRSPAMHNAALRELGLDWLYVPLPVVPERFAEVVPALARSGFRGINVTVPHKVAAHDVADYRTPATAAIGAANTLTFADGALHADNTDAGGFLDALGESPRGWQALVLGAGGSARAVAWALREEGASVAILNRTPERAAKLAADLGVDHASGPGAPDLIVNCTTVGLDPGVDVQDALAAVGLAGAAPPAVLVDLVYGGARTPLAEWASAGGSRTVGGLEVLVRQGARSLERWTGEQAPLDLMRRAAKSG